MKKLFIYSITITLAFMFNACVDSEKVAEKTTEKIIEKASGEKVDIQKDKDGKESKITIKSEDGEEITVSGGDNEIPEKFPKDVFVPKGAVESSGTVASEEGSLITVNISCEKPYSEIKKKLLSEMENKGWTKKQSMDAEGSAMLSFEKNKNNVTVTISEEGDKTSVSYMVTLNTKKE